MKSFVTPRKELLTPPNPKRDRGSEKGAATDARRNRSKSANMSNLDLTPEALANVQAEEPLISLESIGASTVVSHTDVSVLQQAGFFNDCQALIIWKYLNSEPRDMTILENMVSPLSTDRAKGGHSKKAERESKSTIVPLSHRQDKKAEIMAKELETEEKKRNDEFRFRGKMKNTKLLDKMLQDQSVLNRQVDGKIVIKVKGASNLPSKDSYGSYGLPDPYCVIRSTFSSHLVGKTKVIKNSVNPRWDESFTFTVKQSSAKGDFHAIFFDKQAIGNDSMIGMTVIPLYNIIDAPIGIGINARLPFDVTKESKSKKNKKEGDPPLLWIEIQYIPAPVKAETVMSPRTMAKSLTIMDGDNTKLVTSSDVLNEYELGEVLGSGATAIVKAAVQLKDNKKIAVKIVDKTKEEFDDDDQKAFVQEIDILRKAKELSDYLVFAIDVRETVSEIYIMMELMNGGELFDYIFSSEAGCLTPSDAARVVYPLLKGLNFLHNSCYIIHRDIKPENILLSFATEDKSGFPDKIKISDYGASAYFTAKNPYVRGYTGTLTYMSPEILENSKYTKAIDVWSIGIVTYCSMCGFLPFDGDSDAEITQTILEAELQFPSPEWDGCDFLAQSFIISCLTSDSKKRMTIKDALTHPWIMKHNKDRL